MKQSVMLTITSLLSILFMTFHLADDILFGMSPPRFVNLFVVLVFVIWLYGTLVLGERRSGHIIMLVGSLLSMGMPVLHVMAAAGIFHGAIAAGSAAYVSVWTLHAMGVAGMFCFALAVRGLWGMRGGGSGK